MQTGEPLPGTENITGTPKQTFLDNLSGELSDGSTLEDLGYPPNASAGTTSANQGDE